LITSTSLSTVNLDGTGWSKSVDLNGVISYGGGPGRRASRLAAAAVGCQREGGIE
jgi:hypothetical protein